ncbi:MAG: GYD domain-containing protein [Bryobacteraceae bacterium]
MPKFLIEATYTEEGYKGLARDKASGRKAAVTQAAKKMGGKLEAMYYCLGDHDAMLIVDLPDHLCAAALASAACAAGAAHTKTTVLLTVQEADEALSKPVAYRAPGA